MENPRGENSIHLREMIETKDLQIVFRGIFNELCHRTVNQSGLALLLFENHVISLDERKLCLTAPSTFEQNERLYKLVMQRNAGKQLVHALTHSGNYKIVELLSHQLLSEYQGSGQNPDQLVEEMEDALLKSPKPPQWSSAVELQQILMDFQTKLEKNEEQMAKLQGRFDHLTEKYESLEKNPVPIGFIYTQLPGHPQPSKIWPTCQWMNVSGSHGGNFFRVEGGRSGEFGEIQPSATSGGLQEMRTRAFMWPNYDETDKEYRATILTDPQDKNATLWTGRVFTGTYNNHKYPEIWLQFLVTSNEETRPVNEAVRIWKRTG